MIFEGTNEWTQDAIIAKVIDKGNKVFLKLLWFNKIIHNNYYNQLEIAEMSISKKEFIDHNLAEGSFVKLHIAPEKTIGGTIINKIVYSNDRMLISFCEDDFTDKNDNLYIMEAIVESDKFLQNRIIVSYDVYGNRFIEPITGDNWEEVGTEICEKINYDKSEKTFHRNVLNLDSSIGKTSIKELNEISNIIKYKKGRFIFSGILMSFIIFIIISLFFIFSSLSFVKINEYLMLVDFLFCLIIWILSSVKIIKIFSRIPIRRILKEKYKSEILFLEIYETIEYNGCKRLGVSGIIKENNDYVKKNFLLLLVVKGFYIM